MSSRTLASGMMAGITSPARPWFKLQASDPDLNNSAAVKNWLHQVQQTMYRVFSQSNTYNALHTVYAELGVFGTAPMGVFHDFDNVIRCKPYTVGSYCIASNGFNEIDTFYREYELTVAECVKQFGKENCSTHVQQQWENGNTEAWIRIVHVVEPNDDRDMNSPMARDKAWRSVYYEYEADGRGEEKFLRRSGFDDDPILCPRWDITGEDIYATDCPGMTALGDTKALQLGEKRKYQAIDKMSNPQLAGPANLIKRLKNAGVGGHVSTDSPNESLDSIYGNWRPDLNAIMQDIAVVEERIKRSFYEDLFLMISMSDRRQITAREIAEKQEEKLLMLGPVLERLHAELLDPLIDRTFNILTKAGVLPLPPQELQGSELQVEYVSILAQAQRMVAVTGIERLAGFGAQLATVWPEARHKINAIEMIDEYAESVGVNPRTVRADEEAAELNAAEQQAIAAQQANEQAAQAAQTAKTASETDMEGDNALSTMLRNAGLQ
tara:strand:- start:81 stop:1565 length:1485 start_codon:yes stop_codon:yes gene_type:complete